MSAQKPKQKRPQSYATSQARKGKVGWLVRSDKRGVVARRFRDLVAEMSSDLGGAAQLSETMRQIIRRAASLSVWCESQEGRMADGEEINIDEFQRTANSLRRLCESIGLRRVMLDVTPDLRKYIEQKSAKGHAEGLEATRGTHSEKHTPPESISPISDVNCESDFQNPESSVSETGESDD